MENFSSHTESDSDKDNKDNEEYTTQKVVRPAGGNTILTSFFAASESNRNVPAPEPRGFAELLGIEKAAEENEEDDSEEKSEAEQDAGNKAQTQAVVEYVGSAAQDAPENTLDVDATGGVDMAGAIQTQTKAADPGTHFSEEGLAKRSQTSETLALPTREQSADMPDEGIENTIKNVPQALRVAEDNPTKSAERVYQSISQSAAVHNTNPANQKTQAATASLPNNPAPSVPMQPNPYPAAAIAGNAAPRASRVTPATANLIAPSGPPARGNQPVRVGGGSLPPLPQSGANVLMATPVATPNVIQFAPERHHTHPGIIAALVLSHLIGAHRINELKRDAARNNTKFAKELEDARNRIAAQEQESQRARLQEQLASDQLREVSEKQKQPNYAVAPASVNRRQAPSQEKNRAEKRSQVEPIPPKAVNMPKQAIEQPASLFKDSQERVSFQQNSNESSPILQPEVVGATTDKQRELTHERKTESSRGASVQRSADGTSFVVGDNVPAHVQPQQASTVQATQTSLGDQKRKLAEHKYAPAIASGIAGAAVVLVLALIAHLVLK